MTERDEERAAAYVKHLAWAKRHAEQALAEMPDELELRNLGIVPWMAGFSEGVAWVKEQQDERVKRLEAVAIHAENMLQNEWQDRNTRYPVWAKLHELLSETNIDDLPCLDPLEGGKG